MVQHRVTRQWEPVAGLIYEIAPLTVWQNRTVVPGLLKLASEGAFQGKLQTPEQFDLIVDIICVAIRANRAEFMALPVSYNDLLEGLRRVGRQAGLADEDVWGTPRPHVMTLEEATNESVQRLMADFPMGVAKNLVN